METDDALGASKIRAQLCTLADCWVLERIAIGAFDTGIRWPRLSMLHQLTSHLATAKPSARRMAAIHEGVRTTFFGCASKKFQRISSVTMPGSGFAKLGLYGVFVGSFMGMSYQSC